MAKQRPKARPVPVAGSKKAPFAIGTYRGAAPKGEQVTVTLRLRRKAPLASPDGGGNFRVLDYDEFRAKHGADPADVAKVEAFAHEHGLDVPRVSLAQRAIDLSGTVEAMSAAFGTRLKRYLYKGQAYRIRSGEIKIPGALAPLVEGVFGLDNRPRAKPYFRVASAKAKHHRRKGAKAFTPVEIAELYKFPKGYDGTGETIAILEFGGGYRVRDLTRYFANLDLSQPRVSAVSVGNKHNAPSGRPGGVDGEVVLDIEMAGAVAPGAQIVVYFADNTDDGFNNALYAAIHDNLRRPSIVSISWGSAERDSTRQSLLDYDAACIDAAALGITICVASGDDGSSDTGPSGKRANVEFPASSPHVLACGGTYLEAKGGAITSETVWNRGKGGATGGGVSERFPLPNYQKHAGVPKSVNRRGTVGRGVPDVAGFADSHPGYRFFVDGKRQDFGGTSAVAPLWAGLIARLNQAKKKRLGFVHPKLYALGPRKGFRDIVEGNNGAYEAKEGWDPCTGLGTPDGQVLKKVLCG
jgi:kumamolisin